MAVGSVLNMLDQVEIRRVQMDPKQSNNVACERSSEVS